MSRVISKRQARGLFRAAKIAEQQMYPAAEQHRREHGAYPSDFIQAQIDTSRAFGVYLDAGIFSGITVED